MDIFLIVKIKNILQHITNLQIQIINVIYINQLFTIILRSLELRCFFKGILPLPVYQWFTDILLGNEKIEEKPRVDYYLATQSIDIGVKFSRQQLQLKIRKYNVDFTLKNKNIQGSLDSIINQYLQYTL